MSVGFEYETCPSLILWEKRTALLQGFELDPSNLGGWSLDKHHVLNIKSGKFIDIHLWGGRVVSLTLAGNLLPKDVGEQLSEA